MKLFTKYLKTKYKTAEEKKNNVFLVKKIFVKKF